MSATPTPRRRRSSIYSDLRQRVFTEAAYRCSNPRCQVMIALDMHHIVPVSEGGENRDDNLIVLCATCHARHTRGEIPRETIITWKRLLVALNHALDRESMDLLLFLHLNSDTPIWYSGDGVLRFAGLIAAGLATLAASLEDPGITQWTARSSHQVKLTDRGRLVIEAWLNGDERRFYELADSA